MTVYTLSSSLPEDSFVDWTQNALWAQGSAPDDSGAQVFFNDTGRDYFVEIEPGQTISIGPFSLAANHLLLDGALVSAGSVSIAADTGIQIYGGALSAQSLHVNGTSGVDVGLVGVGTVTVAGPIYNDSAIISGNETGLSSLTALTLNAAYIDNLGLLEASVASTLTVNVTLASGVANYAYGTLTGGTYDAESNATLNLKTNGLIANDSATLVLGGAGTDIIASYNPTTGDYVPIQSSLTLVTPTGTLELDAASYTTSVTLTVQGVLKLVGAADFSAGTLYVTSGGTVDLSDAYPGESMTLSAGHILNDGQIFVDAVGGAIATIAGPVSGAGSIVLGPAILSILHYGGSPVVTTANAELTGADSNSLTFSDGTGSFLLDVPAELTGSVQHFTAGDSLILPHIVLSSVTSYAYVGSAGSGVLTVQEGGTTLHFAFTGSYTTADFALSTDLASGGLAITGTSLIGVAPATHTV